MRPPVLTRPAALLAVAAGLMIALAGCDDKAKTDSGKKDKKNPPPNKTTPPPPPPPAAPAEKIDGANPALITATQLVQALAKGQDVNIGQVTPRFLGVIGKPLGSRERGQPFSEFAAKSWLQRAGYMGFGRGANIGPLMGGFRVAPNVVVATSTFTDPQVPKGGHYLIRMVDEGGWKLDWFEVSTVEALPSPAPVVANTSEEPFQDFAVLAFADLVSTPPAALPEPLEKENQALLASALLSPAFRQRLDVNQPLDPEGLDYKRGVLTEKLKTFVGPLGTRVVSHQRSWAAAHTYKVVFNVEGQPPKAFQVKLVSAGPPGLWLVDDFISVPV